MSVKKGLWMASLFISNTVLADPFDDGEAYASRATAPEWMDNVDVGLFLLNNAVFALSVFLLAYFLFKKPALLMRLEQKILAPFRWLFALARSYTGIIELLLQGFAGLVVFMALAAWVFFCQWLKHEGFGAISMFALAILALLFVRLLKGKEKPRPI